MDSWFLRTIPNMLEQLADESHGYPVSLDGLDVGGRGGHRNEWQEILREMAAKFRDAGGGTCATRNPYQEEWSQAYAEFEREYGLFGERLEEADPDGATTMHFPSEFLQWRGVMEKYSQAQADIRRFRRQCFDEAMGLFHVWFWNLWD